MGIEAVYRGFNIRLRDFQREPLAYFEAAAQRKLMLPRCKACGLLRWPPNPGCTWCTSLDYEWHQVSGKGTIYSYEIVTHAINPGFREDVPYPIVLVELDEQKDVPEPGYGLRIMMNLVDENFKFEDQEKVAIGERVEVVFHEITPEFVLPQWKLSGEPPRGRVWQHPSNRESI